MTQPESMGETIPEDVYEVAYAIADGNLSEEDTIAAIARAILAERERMVEAVASWMRNQGYATGHGDTVEMLLTELTWQIAERVEKAAAIRKPTP